MNFPRKLHYVEPLKVPELIQLVQGQWLAGNFYEQEIVEFAVGSEWENFCLERAGDMTSYLSTKYRNQYQEWNTLVEGYKPVLNKYCFSEIESIAKSKNLPEILADQIRWNIIYSVMEITYQKCHSFKFFSSLLENYKTGQLAYGWEGEYPEGMLLCAS